MTPSATRRVFLGSLAASAAATPLDTRLARGSARAGNTLRLAVLGVNGRGHDLASSFATAGDCQVVALCDPDTRTFARALEDLARASDSAPTPRVEQDFRRILDDPAIDAVAIATPDHWHALLTILACQAGKDVYVEKPVSHNVVEGRRMVEAARKHDRIVQAGTQRRSARSIQDAIAHVHAGGIGRVAYARSWIHQKRGSIGRVAASPPPAELDWALWQGPAPEQPFHANRVHYGWHWFWNYGTGELGNNGIHGLDLARWGLQVDAPLAVTSGGGKFHFDDDQEVPDTQTVVWEFPHASLVWEHRMWSAHGDEGSSFGVAFHGDKGTLVISDKGWRVEDGDAAGGPPTPLQEPHIADFLDAVRARRRPNADIEVGHLSTRLCHLGNIAHRTGKKLAFDAATESFPHEPEASALLGRAYNPRFPLPAQV
jgi:predicted dehydrogenase